MLTSSGRRPEGCGWRGPRGCLRPSVTVAAKETGAPLLTGSSGEGSEGSALPSGTAAGNLPGEAPPGGVAGGRGRGAAQRTASRCPGRDADASRGRQAPGRPREDPSTPRPPPGLGVLTDFPPLLLPLTSPVPAGSDGGGRFRGSDLALQRVRVRSRLNAEVGAMTDRTFLQGGGFSFYQREPRQAGALRQAVGRGRGCGWARSRPPGGWSGLGLVFGRRSVRRPSSAWGCPLAGLGGSGDVFHAEAGKAR